MGKHLSMVFSRLDTARENILKAIVEKKVTKDARIFYQHHHDIFYENVTIFPLITNDVEGAVIKVDDITYQVRMEETLEIAGSDYNLTKNMISGR